MVALSLRRKGVLIRSYHDGPATFETLAANIRLLAKEYRIEKGRQMTGEEIYSIGQALGRSVTALDRVVSNHPTRNS